MGQNEVTIGPNTTGVIVSRQQDSTANSCRLWVNVEFCFACVKYPFPKEKHFPFSLLTTFLCTCNVFPCETKSDFEGFTVCAQLIHYLHRGHGTLSTFAIKLQHEMLQMLYQYHGTSSQGRWSNHNRLFHGFLPLWSWPLQCICIPLHWRRPQHKWTYS